MPVDPLPTLKEIDDWNSLLDLYNKVVSDKKFTYKQNGRDVTVDIPDRKSLDRGDISKKIYDSYVESHPDFSYNKDEFVGKMQRYFGAIQSNPNTKDLQHAKAKAVKYDPSVTSSDDIFIGDLTSQYYIPKVVQTHTDQKGIRGNVTGIVDPYRTDGSYLRVLQSDLTDYKGDRILDDISDPLLDRFINNKVENPVDLDSFKAPGFKSIDINTTNTNNGTVNTSRNNVTGLNKDELKKINTSTGSFNILSNRPPIDATSNDFKSVNPSNLHYDSQSGKVYLKDPAGNALVEVVNFDNSEGTPSLKTNTPNTTSQGVVKNKIDVSTPPVPPEGEVMQNNVSESNVSEDFFDDESEPGFVSNKGLGAKHKISTDPFTSADRYGQKIKTKSGKIYFHDLNTGEVKLDPKSSETIKEYGGKLNNGVLPDSTIEKPKINVDLSNSKNLNKSSTKEQDKTMQEKYYNLNDQNKRKEMNRGIIRPDARTAKSTMIKESGFEEGGQLDEEVEVTGEGELEEVSEEISKAEGPSHEEGGMKLNTGDEIRGDETVNVKKGMVFSASLINPETNNPFAKDHEALAKQMKEVEGRPEKWAVKKLGVLKEKEHELFEKQQALNGNNGEGEMEDGGLTDGDPPVKAGSKVPQIRYFVANGESYEVNPKKYDQFIKEFPDAKEYEKLSDNTFVEANSPLAKAGQKKNEPLSKAATTTKTTTKPTDGFQADWNIVKDLLPQEKVDVVKTEETPDQLGGLDIQGHKDLYKEVIPLVEKIGANKFIEPLIGEQQKELIGTQNPLSKITTFGVFNDIIKDQIKANYDPETQKLIDQYGPEYERVLLGAARIIRDEENSFVGKKMMEELYKQEQGILQYEKGRTNEGKNVGTIVPANVETSKGFDYSFEDLVSKFKGIKLKDEKGRVIDTDNITPSQLKEIEAYVKNSYQTFRNLKIEGDNLNKTVEAIANGKNEFMTGQYDENGLYVGEKMVKVDEGNPLYAQAKEAIDQGIIPKDSDFWKGFLDKSNSVNQKYTKIYNDLQTTIDIDTEASKLALQKEDAEFTNSAIPRLEQAQADIQNKIDKGEISFEAGSLLLEQTESAINQQRTQIYDKWSKKINANIQQQMKLVNESYNTELKDMFTNSVYEGLDISKVDEQYINKSLQAFYGIVGEQVDKNLGNQYVQLNKLANDAYQLNPDWKIGGVSLTNTGKITTEFGRGVLQMGESLGGLVSFLGGWELGNILTDTYQQYNADNPQLNTGDIKMADFLNPDFYIANLVPSMPMAITFTGLGLITGGAAGGVAESIGASGVGKTIFQGVAGSFMETPLMALSEAGSDFTEQMNNGVSADVAANMAADTFAGNMSLWYMNVGQLMMAFTPLGKIKGVKSALLKAPAGIVTEGGEEVYQGHLTQHNPYQTLLDYAFSPMGKKEFVIGGVMGLAFSAPDAAATIAGKDDKSNSALMYDMLMTGDMATEYQRIKQGLDLMKSRDQIAPEKYDAAMQQLEFALLKGREIPANLKPEQKQNIFSILSDINKIEQVKATTTDPTLIKTYDKEIGALEKQVQETMAGTQPMYFIGRVSYTKEQFEQLVETPEVAAQIVSGETTVGVFNDDAVKSKIEALYDTENKNRIQGGIENGQELVEGELDKGASGEEISPSGVVQNEEGIVDITPEDQEFVDIFEEAKGYTGLRKIEAMDELKTKNSAKFAQVSFIDDNLDVIAEKLNIKKDCK